MKNQGIALCLLLSAFLFSELIHARDHIAVFEELYHKSRFGGVKVHSPMSNQEINYALNYAMFGDTFADQEYIQNFLDQALMSRRSRDNGKLAMMISYLSQKTAARWTEKMPALARKAAQNRDFEMQRFIFIYASGEVFLNLLSERPRGRFAEILTERLEQMKSTLIRAVFESDRRVLEENLLVIQVILVKIESLVGDSPYLLGKIHSKTLELLRLYPTSNSTAAELLKLYENRDSFSGQKSVYAIKDCRFLL